jgi:hypothetical protein
MEREPSAAVMDDDEPTQSLGWRNRVGMFGRRHTGTAH